MTTTAGVGDPGWADGAAFLDYDADGWLDLFICNYVHWDVDEDRECTIAGTSRRDYCGPLAHKAEPDLLYHNNGDRNAPGFTNVSVAAGIEPLVGTGMGVGAADFNGDGLQDIYVGNDALPNRLLVQQPDHTFVDRANEMLCDLSAEGIAQSSMGITIEDFNLDGRLDLLLGHYSEDPNTLYLNERGRMFNDVSLRTGLHAATRRFTTFGISTLDLRNDGRMQLYFGNGKANMASKVAMDEADGYAERDLLLEWSFENRRFTDVTAQAGPALETALCTRGTAVIDYDNDGDMDLVTFANNGPVRLLRNNAPRSNHWLQVRCIGPDSKRDAYGAVVEVEVQGKKTRRRPLYVACSYCSSSDPRVHFGLGKTDRVVRLTVHWVDGKQSTWRQVPADQLFVARYSDSDARVASGSRSPDRTP